MPVVIKLIYIATVKFASLDPFGMGVMMDGSEQGFFPALDGLPSMLGSDVGASYELLRLLRFLVMMKPTVCLSTPS